MAKSPSLLDLLAMVPAGDIARTACAIDAQLFVTQLRQVDAAIQMRAARSGRGASRCKAAAKPRGRREAR